MVETLKEMQWHKRCKMQLLVDVHGIVILVPAIFQLAKHKDDKSSTKIF